MLFGRRYRATERIGSGGMADVYKAVDEVLGRTVAVKVMHSRYASDPSFTARFRQEAQAAANLQSPYIVNMYDWGQDGDTYYIAMEYVRGTDLKTLLQQRGALSSERVAEIGSQVCAALAVAHGYDVIHRDIKPHNIMVQPDGSVKVMDFGIARAGNTSMTQTGSVLGTAHYVSPEQAQGRPLTPASDLYSVGIVLYEAATGRLPFDADSPVSIALKQVNESPKAPHEIKPDIDPGLEAVILTAMAKKATDRYDSADEMRRDLIRVVQGHEVLATAVIPTAALGNHADETAVMRAVGGQPPLGVRPVSRRRPVWPWIVLAVLLIAGGIAVANALGVFESEPEDLVVPNVVSMSEEQATGEILDAGLTVGDITQAYDDEVPAGAVISQNPEARTSVPPSSTVDLVVSQGRKLVAVPRVIGLTEEKARDAITKAGLTPEPLPDEYSTEVEVGVVFKQDPAAGAELPEGAAVQFTVSRGKRTATVPNVVGNTRSQAETTLRNAGFKVSVREQFNNEVAANKVVSQSPLPKTEVVEGSTVEIVVSKGPEDVAVPDVIGNTLTQAVATLESQGLVASVTYEPHSENGTVLAQDPPPDTKVKRGSTVTIIVDATEP
jgi:serine/threonine-protein kinase